jgi:hypothetical protein
MPEVAGILLSTVIFRVVTLCDTVVKVRAKHFTLEMKAIRPSEMLVIT